MIQKIINVNLIYLVITILLSALLSCANTGDTTTDLGNGYFYKVDGKSRWISTDHVMKDEIYPNVVDYVYNSDFIIAVQKPDVHFSEFLARDLMYKYIYLKENFDTTDYDLNTNRFIHSYLWTDTNINLRIKAALMNKDIGDINDKLKIVTDSVLRNNKFYKNILSKDSNYWIIKKIDNTILGPYFKNQYIHIRKELNLLPGFHLKDE